MEDLIDRIYEAAFVPELWPVVLDGLSTMSGSVGGALLVASEAHPPRFAASASIMDALIECSSDAWRNNDRPLRWKLSVDGFLRDGELFSPDELETDPMRHELIRYGLGWQTGMVIPMTNGEVVIYSVERRLQDGPHDPTSIASLNVLRPHLARAGLVAARLGLERALATVSALQSVGLPAAVMSAGGQVVATNGLFDALPSIFQPLAYDGLAIGDPKADLLFQQAVRSTSAAIVPIVRSIPVRQTIDQPAVVLHVLPLRRSARDIFAGANILVVAASIRMGNQEPSPQILSALFDLSPAEAKLAASLVSGRPLKAAALDHGITVKTARTYLERVFYKTGTGRQSELVALLSGAAPLAPLAATTRL